MKARRSLLKVLATFLILAAAITAAYGSQTAKSYEFKATDDAGKEIAESSLTLRTQLQSDSVPVNLRDLEKEKLEIKKAIKKNSEIKVVEATKEKPKIQKPLPKKPANSKKATRVAVTAKQSKKVATAKPVSAQKSDSAKTLSREEIIMIKQKKAEQILAYYISKYPILKGVKVYVRDCPNNWQGCAYYTKGIILVDPDHTAPLQKIIEHEVMHIIDWRTDNKIDYNDYHE